MRWDEEAEAEEGDDYEVDEADGDRGDGAWAVERAEVVDREADGWRKGLQGADEGVDRARPVEPYSIFDKRQKAFIVAIVSTAATCEYYSHPI